MAEIRVHEKIFEDYPTFRRGIVVAKKMQNSGHSKELEALLREVTAEAAERPIDLKADPRIMVWNEAHRQFGSNPNKYPPAHCALLKRVQKPGAQIPFINKTVAIMNYNAIKDKIPVGGDDLMRAGGTLELRYAEGTENFTPLGKPDTVEHPDPGEIIYVVSDSGEVMCRRWNWRNGHKTLITEETQIIVMNTDGLGEDSEERAVITRDRVARMLREFCQAKVITTLLSPSQPSYLS
ncbi:MAG: phenylalanine--tRNA ligase beta subunit-related protein [Desulfobacteraceae bacterium]|jgi:DNA/RNA-binding domain of Phe-tRNA-synthetase-like protein